MRTNQFDKLAFLVVLCAAVLVALAAAGTGPAYSDDSRTDPVQTARVSAVGTVEMVSVSSQPQPVAQPQADVKAIDPDGYEWSGSRPTDQRYLWSHRPH